MPMSQRGNGERKEESVVVAIDKDNKGSQYALKWAVDNLLGKGRHVTLLHVIPKQSSSSGGNMIVLDGTESIPRGRKNEFDTLTRELFLPFRCFCTRKDIRVREVAVEDMDIVKGLCDYVKQNLVEYLVLGASVRSGIVRKFKTSDIPASVCRAAADFCNVYVIAKGKISTSRAASTSVPHHVPNLMQYPSNGHPALGDHLQGHGTKGFQPEKSPSTLRNLTEDSDSIQSPFNRGRAPPKASNDHSFPDTDISFVSSGRPSTERSFPFSSESLDLNIAARLSHSWEAENKLSFGSPFAGSRTESNNSYGMYSASSQDSGTSWTSSPHSMDDVEAEMRRLKLELKQTMDMYSNACKEALTAKQKALELQRMKVEEEHKLEEAKLAQEAAMAIAEKEKAKCKAAIEAAEAAKRIAELEAQKRINAERKALKEAEEKKKVLDVLAHSDTRYRKYSIEEIETATDKFSDSRKIGEGGYGPVYKCYLDHTPVAIKVLRPDAAQGRSQFQQEVEVLSCIRHPNMVLLLGACPDYGCLVYEYMANGSLDDCLFRRGNTPPLSWQLRFRIAAEIGTGLLFLHQTKPEPLVHRDLKPANILLDRNYVSKISDVGLARLVPPSVADSVTQYLMTSTAGTFCYIDPEYQQTGMLGIKSDIYSLGVVLLQIITAKSPMGLTHHVERSIEKGTFTDMLDPEITDWPVEEALKFAKLALKCTELRRKDRPDLGDQILPELDRMRALAEETMPSLPTGSKTSPT